MCDGAPEVLLLRVGLFYCYNVISESQTYSDLCLTFIAQYLMLNTEQLCSVPTTVYACLVDMCLLRETNERDFSL
jgi:hypothetical protein